MRNQLWTNSNPVQANICPQCSPFIDCVFAPGDELPLPAHPGCYCTYFPTDKPPTGAVDWDKVQLDTRRAWVRYVAYHLRAVLLWKCPPALRPLLEDAKQFNRDRKKKESNPMSDIDSQKNTSTKIHAGRVLLSPTKQTSRREYECVFMQPGFVKRADQEASNWLIPARTIRAAVNLFDARPVYLDHPELFGFGWHQSPQIRDLAAVTFSPKWNEENNELRGNIRLYDKDPNSTGAFVAALLDQILEDKEAGREIPPVGLSAVVFHETEFDQEEGVRISTQFTYVESEDIVYDAGAGGYVRAALAVLGREIPRRFLISSTPPAGGLGPQTIGGNQMSQEAIHTEDGGPQRQQPPPAVPAASVDADPLAAIQTASDQLAALTAQVAVLTPPPPPEESKPPTTEARLDTMAEAIERLTITLAQDEETRTIQNVGKQAVLRGGLAGLDQVQIAIEGLLSGVRPAQDVAPLSGIRELYHLLSGDYEMSGLFQEDRIYLANVNSSTMAKLVADALNKRVVNEFQTYPRWWEPIVKPENFTSLQDVKWITLGGVGELPTVGEGQAYDEMTWDDIQQKDTFIKKGGYLGLTLEAIDKDDTRKLISAPRALAQAAWLTLSKSISAIFTANSGVGPTIYYDDSNTRALFHTSNSNLGTTAFSWAAWVATRTAMMKQAEYNSGERLGALTAAYYALVPIDLEITALQVFASMGEPGTADNDENPLAQGSQHDERVRNARKRVIAVPLWTNTSNWAAIADPRLYPTIGLGFRFGHTPEIFAVASPTAGLMFTNDTMPIKVRFFYATGPMDYRGLYKHNI